MKLGLRGLFLELLGGRSSGLGSGLFLLSKGVKGKKLKLT